MRSAAETTTAALKRGVNLLEQVDYRLAQTPDEKEEIYHLRYRAYLREGAVKASAEQRVTDQFADVRMASIMLGRGVRRNPDAKARPRRGDRRPGEVRRGPRQGRPAPGTALCDASPRLHGVRIFQRRSRARDRSS